MNTPNAQRIAILNHLLDLLALVDMVLRVVGALEGQVGELCAVVRERLVVHDVPVQN